MKHLSLVLAAIFCFGLSAPGQTAPKDATALRREIAAAVTAMGRVGRAGGASFSPDGKWISFVADLSGVPQVWVVPVEGGYPRMVTNGDDPVLGAVWSPASDRIAVTIAPGGGLNSQVYLVRPDGSEMRRLTDGGKDNNAFNAWTDDGKKIAIDSNRLDPAARDCFLIDVASGDIKLVSHNPGVGNIDGISKDGKLALLQRLRNRGDNNLYLLDLAAGKDTLLTRHDGTALYTGEIAPDGKTVYLVSDQDRDLAAFGRISLGSGERKLEILASREDGELTSVTLNKQGTMAALVWNVRGLTELSFYDLVRNKQLPGPKAPGEIAGGIVFSPDGTMLALGASGPAQSADIWVMEMSTQKFRQLTFSPHVGVDLRSLVRPELVTFKAHDGLELSGWLYRPKNQSGPGPYVVSFHGGPEGQERPAFRTDYQALLSQGIGVFAPQRARVGGLRQEIHQPRQRPAAG